MNKMSRDELTVRVQMADEISAELKVECARFCEQQRPNITISYEGATSRASVPLINLPVQLRVRIGMAAYLLRSTLDHLVTYLILQNGNTPSHRNQFPIGHDVLGCVHPRSGEMLEGLSEKQCQIIHGFCGVDPTIWPFTLLELNAICNIDKHRRSHRASALLTELSDDYRRREFECSEQGEPIPTVNKDDLIMRVCFIDDRKLSNAQRRLQGEVVGKLNECSAAVKGIMAYLLDDDPVSWPFLRG